ncbi:MAG: hypothetical protein WAX33_04405 [Rectinemataceae bacterium]
MTEYTPEQIEEAKKWFSSFMGRKQHGLHEEYGFRLLAALEAAEKERDEHERKGKELCILAGNLGMERNELKARAEKAEACVKELDRKICADRACEYAKSRMNSVELEQLRDFIEHPEKYSDAVRA